MKVIAFKDGALSQKKKFGKIRMAQDSRLYDVRNFHISLKQWRMLHAVVDCDGFTGAANKLHVSQSAISYTVSKLQEQLGLPLLKIEGRKAHITDEGKILLERSRNLIREALELEALAENLRQGWGAEVRLVVDENFPTQLLMTALRKFSLFAQNIKVDLSEVTMHQAEKALRERNADLAVCSQVPAGFVGDALIEVEHVAVAHPAHPLFGLGRNIKPSDLSRQVQIIISSSADHGQGNSKHQALGHVQPWNVSSFDTAVAALCECLGYAWLPRHRLEKWLDRGELRILPLVDGSTYKTSLYLIHGRSLAADSAAKKLADVLSALAADTPVDNDPDLLPPPDYRYAVTKMSNLQKDCLGGDFTKP